MGGSREETAARQEFAWRARDRFPAMGTRLRRYRDEATSVATTTAAFAGELCETPHLTMMRVCLLAVVLALAAPACADPLPGPGRAAEPGVVVGRMYMYRVETHCGVWTALIDGTWWTAAPELGSGGAPPAWDEPSQEGVLRLTDRDVAEFDAGEGRKATFKRTADRQPRRICR